jgi:hypothetical protein
MKKIAEAAGARSTQVLMSVII